MFWLFHLDTCLKIHTHVHFQVGRSAGFKGGAAEDALQPRTAAQVSGSGSLLRSGRGLRLGLGAVTRTTTGSTKGRGAGPGQRSALVFSQPVQPVSPATSQKSQDNAGKCNIRLRQSLLSHSIIKFYVRIWDTQERISFFLPPLQHTSSCGTVSPLKLALDEGSSLECILFSEINFGWCDWRILGNTLRGLSAPKGCHVQNKINK